MVARRQHKEFLINMNIWQDMFVQYVENRQQLKLMVMFHLIVTNVTKNMDIAKRNQLSRNMDTELSDT